MSKVVRGVVWAAGLTVTCVAAALTGICWEAERYVEGRKKNKVPYTPKNMRDW